MSFLPEGVQVKLEGGVRALLVLKDGRKVRRIIHFNSSDTWVPKEVELVGGVDGPELFLRHGRYVYLSEDRRRNLCGVQYEYQRARSDSTRGSTREGE